ncbi:MAG TPA: hypothetical protein VIV60_03740 [Polyangiaceae bacterium]
MGDKLKPGGLGDADDPSDFPNAFANSMAKAMEDALNDLLDDEDKPTLPTDNSPETRDRRLMFVAIARGIVNHLVANEAAFTIRRDDDTVRSDHNVRIATG